MRDAFGAVGLKSLSACGLGVIPGTVASATRRPDGSVAFGGATVCDNALICPVCAPRIASARIEALKPQIARLIGASWSPVLITLTLRHGREDSLPGLLGVIFDAWRSLAKSRQFRDLGAQFVRGTDVTHGDANGWHPHMHLVLMVPPERDASVFPDGPRERDVSAFAESVLTLWQSALAKAGGEAERVALRWETCRNAEHATAYALKACAAALSEVVSPGGKSGRFGRTIGDLGERVRSRSCQRSARLLVEAALALKGRRLFAVSSGLTFDLPEGEPKPEGDVIALFPTGRGLARLDRHLPAFVAAARVSVAEARAVLVRELGPPGSDRYAIWRESALIEHGEPDRPVVVVCHERLGPEGRPANHPVSQWWAKHGCAS